MSEQQVRGVNNTRQSREEYDRLWSGTWGDLQHYGPVHRHQRHAVIALIGKLDIQSVLDVGCGSGENLAALASAMPHLALSGVDVSTEALMLASKRTPNIRLRELDVQHEKLNEHFDLVLSI